MSYAQAKGYLHYLRAKGHPLPLDTRADGDPLDDLAVDVLGPFLQSAPGRPFSLIFDYYRRAGFDDLAAADPADLYQHFTILLRGFVRKELCRLRGDADPQLDHLKRRFKDILKPPEYQIDYPDRDGRARVARRTAGTGMHEPTEPISAVRLAEIVERAYLDSTNRGQWCRRIFELLEEDAGSPDWVYRHEVLGAVIGVNLKYCDIDGLRPGRPSAAEQGLYLRDATEAREAAVAALRDGPLAGFIAKGRLTEDEGRRFEYAFELYVTDLVHTGEADLLPVYFREVMPEEAASQYLTRYKYVFETALNAALGHFRDHLRNSPTGRRYGAYF
jgi:hypothetical protein